MASTTLQTQLLEYLVKVAHFSPETATDAERAAILAEGATLIKTNLDPPRQLSMEEIIKQEAAGVNTSGVNVPHFSGTAIDADLAEIDQMIVSQNATRKAYAEGIGNIVKTVVSVAAMAATA